MQLVDPLLFVVCRKEWDREASKGWSKATCIHHLPFLPRLRGLRSVVFFQPPLQEGDHFAVIVDGWARQLGLADWYEWVPEDGSAGGVSP